MQIEMSEAHILKIIYIFLSLLSEKKYFFVSFNGLFLNKTEVLLIHSTLQQIRSYIV